MFVKVLLIMKLRMLLVEFGTLTTLMTSYGKKKQLMVLQQNGFITFTLKKAICTLLLV